MSENDLEFQYWKMRRLVRLALIIWIVFFGICILVSLAGACDCHCDDLYGLQAQFSRDAEIQSRIEEAGLQAAQKKVWDAYYRWRNEDQDHDIIDEVYYGLDGD